MGPDTTPAVFYHLKRLSPYIIVIKTPESNSARILSGLYYVNDNNCPVVVIFDLLHFRMTALVHTIEYFPHGMFV